MSENQACISGYCDNDGVGAADDGWCFTPSGMYDSEDNKCEESANSAVDDNADEYRSECIGTEGFVDDSCNYYDNGDSNQDVCICVEGSWNIGGEVASAACCEDDSNEFALYRTANSARDCPSSITTSLSDDACCSRSDKCVIGSACYSSENGWDSATGSVPNRAFCYLGEWVGGDFGSGACEAMVSGTQEGCDTDGEQGCWSEQAGKCCGDDGDADDWAAYSGGDNIGNCSNGVWVTPGCKNDADCDDTDDCTQDTCNIATGKCSNTLLNGDLSETICTECYGNAEWFGSICCGDDSYEYTISPLSSGLTLIYAAKSCCASGNACAYDGECYNSGTATVDIDGNGDLDYCDNGIWKDCGSSPDDECSGAYPQCSSNICASDCYGEPCLAGQSTCLDYEEGLLYCVNSTYDDFSSSFVENPAGDGSEGYCHADEFYKTGFRNYCMGKTTSTLCYEFARAGNVYTLSLSHTASTEYCDVDGFYYLTTALPSTDEPDSEPSLGPIDESGEPILPSIFLEHGCIDTDGGENPKQWGCVFSLEYDIYDTDVDSIGDTQFLHGHKVCDTVDNGDLIEFSCDGDSIRKTRISCPELLGTLSDTPYCFNSGVISERSTASANDLTDDSLITEAPSGMICSEEHPCNIPDSSWRKG